MFGKAVLCVQSFSPTQLRMNLGPDTVHQQETTGLHSLYWAYHIVWDYLPCFILSLYSFVLFMCVSLNTWPAPLLYLSSVGRGGDHSEVQEGSMQANGPVLASRSACWPLGPTPTTKAELSLSPLHVSKASLHSVFDCTVFLDVSTTNVQWTEVCTPCVTPGGKQQMPLAQQFITIPENCYKYRIRCGSLVTSPHFFLFYLTQR